MESYKEFIHLYAFSSQNYKTIVKIIIDDIIDLYSRGHVLQKVSKKDLEVVENE